MAANMRANTQKAKRTDKASIRGKMEAISLAVGKTTRSMVSVPMSGAMVDSTKDSGSITRCTVKVNTNGRMDVCT